MTATAHHRCYLHLQSLRSSSKAIGSLTRQSLDFGDYEILVIDNSPDHEKSKDVSKSFLEIPNLTWVIEKTPGLSNARNVASDRARAPIIAYMDDDAIARPDWLEAMLAAFEEFGTSAQVAGGRVEPLWEIPRPEWLHDSLLGYVSVVDWGGATRISTDSEWVAGTNIAFRVKALQDVGGFPVHLGRKHGGQSLLSNDEVDVVEKLGAKNIWVIYAPHASVQHLVPAERLKQSWVSPARRMASGLGLSPESAAHVRKGAAILERRDGLLCAAAREGPHASGFLYRSARSWPVSDADFFHLQLHARIACRVCRPGRELADDRRIRIPIFRRAAHSCPFADAHPSAGLRKSQTHLRGLQKSPRQWRADHVFCIIRPKRSGVPSFRPAQSLRCGEVLASLLYDSTDTLATHGAGRPPARHRRMVRSRHRPIPAMDVQDGGV
ncbi:MAG: glycosyltransferase [Rhizomicrobium sp.]